MKSCGDCRECCLGTLSVKVRGITYDNGNPCKFSKKKGCTIYSKRPRPCKTYNCGWRLYDFMPDWMRPDKSRVLINRGTKEALSWDGQMIDHLIPIEKDISQQVIDYLKQKVITKEMPPFRFLRSKGKSYTMGAVGTQEFQQFIAQQGMPK